ncbi:sulfite exporter TauE/SafE family protein [Pyrococcus kukulkanii]|uniref:sulfite exporter TauE/SafE family protein n=1 Tax=Pyrococcus kukulkanii TaxID=1609559 RepID=UPI000ADF04B2
MTPSLIFLGVRPEVAVGTDFLFSLLTKIFATALHGKKGNVRIDIAWRLIAGSVPAVLLGAFILIRLPREELGQLLVTLIGVVLVVVSALSLGFEIPRFLRPRWIYVYILGFYSWFKRSANFCWSWNNSYIHIDEHCEG